MTLVPRVPSALAHALLVSAAVVLTAPLVEAADPFQEKVVPFVNSYCIRCHNDKKASGELNLAKFTSTAKVVEDFRQWQQVLTFLVKHEMPPAEAKQPTDEGRAEQVAALEKILLTEARKFAGDPGVVAPRRLSNAEYDNTIREITGVDIRPARSFPVDPASGEGFNNTGEALSLSPALFKKYYAAAEQVAEHAVLTTTGLQFAPHPAVAFADRQKLYEQAILKFYESHAVDYEKYFTALWLYQHRAASRKATTVEEWAKEAGLSPKYAHSLWDSITGESADPFLIQWLRTRWAALPAPRNPMAPAVGEVAAAARALSVDIQGLSRSLCPPESRLIIPDAGNGPIEHLARRTRIAETRDMFDKSTTESGRFTWQYQNATDRPSLKIVIEITTPAEMKAGGTVALTGSFTTNHATTDGKKKWSLRELLNAEQLEKLNFDGDTVGIAVPGALEVDVSMAAFKFKDRGSLTFAADCKLENSAAGAVFVRVLNRKPARNDDQDLARPLVEVKRAGPFTASAVAFCKLFPSRFVFVDSTRGVSAGFHLIEGFFRDDRPLCRSVLSAAENQELDRLWTELYFVTGIWEKQLRGFVFFERSERNFLKHHDFDSFKEEDPELVKDETLVRFKEVYLKRAGVKVTGEELAKHPISIFFEDERNGLRNHAATLAKNEAVYLRDVLAFAEKAYRRPLTNDERRRVKKFYGDICRDKDHGIEAAVRASIVRILVSPHFCLHLGAAAGGEAVAPLSDLALASRLSYFLWAGPPDDELLALAKAGRLRDDHVLREQVRRMLKDPKVSRFALEFFGQWLGYRDFLAQETVNRQVFPAFDDTLKIAMFEEPTRLITYLIQQSKPITELLDGDATLVNKKLAQHYGLPFKGKSDEWEVATGLHAAGRGGVLGMAVILTKNSQPQRTSPVKRGFWVVHKLLGEHIPPPPPDVAVLPAKETDTNGKTIRELMRLHVADAKCAACHQRFDSIGLAMEGFDPIGRSRAKDLAGRPIDNAVSLPSGKTTRGIPEFGDWLAQNRRKEFATTLCHKFLGYALGRSLQLSDQPLLDEMQAALDKNGYKLPALFELVAASPQFRTQRCKDFSLDKFKSVKLGERGPSGP
jgi:hypothetical protein